MKMVGCKLPYMGQALNLNENKSEIRICGIKEENYSVHDFWKIWESIKSSNEEETKQKCPLIKRCNRAVFELFENFKTTKFNAKANFSLTFSIIFVR